MKKEDLFRTSSEDKRRYQRIPKLSALSRYPAVYKLVFEMKMSLEYVPVVSIGVRRFFHRKRLSLEKYVTKTHQIVIDGYPRTANSYSRVRFLLANPDVKSGFGNHIHLPSQILLAVRYGIPTVLLVRDPKSAILSLTALQMQSGEDSAAYRRRIHINGRYYCLFHEQVLPTLDSVVVSPFERTISKFNDVIQEVNEKFGTSFNSSVSTVETDSQIFEASPKHLSPSESRNQVKQRLKELAAEKEFRSLFERCDAAYQSILARVSPSALK